MSLEDERKLLISLLDDDHGVSENAYKLMQTVFASPAYRDIFDKVDATGGRFYLEEGDVRKHLPQEYTGHVVSTATLRIEDLLENFYDFLKTHKGRLKAGEFEKLQEEVEPLLKKIAKNHEKEPKYGAGYLTDERDIDNASYLVNEDMYGILNEIAPIGTYFGAHVGDGALFGFWVVSDLVGGDETGEEE